CSAWDSSLSIHIF
nr:immunoglobulin light chain junction region [Macaca mulatta]